MSNIIKVFSSRRMLAVLLLGFASGLPLALTAGTLQAWMKSVSIDIKTIGLFALVGWPYTSKFLWAPFLDRFAPPFMDRRRGWILIAQFLLIVTFVLTSFQNPVENVAICAILATAIAFFSASQDIVIDAYRAELLEDHELGAGAAISTTGYRIAMLTSGALALILSESMPWSDVYRLMALFMLLGVVGTLIAPLPHAKIIPPRSLAQALINPFLDFFKRRGALEILCFILIYKLGDVVALALSTPFMMEIGFSRADIGYVSKGIGFGCTIVGGLVGGALMVKMKMKDALYYFGLIQCITILYFAYFATVGKNYAVMTTAIAIENFGSGLGTAAFVAFLMSLCNKGLTATQYALLSSFAALTRIFVGSSTGYMAQSLGWPLYFVAATALALPGLMLVLLRFEKWKG